MYCHYRHSLRRHLASSSICLSCSGRRCPTLCEPDVFLRGILPGAVTVPKTSVMSFPHLCRDLPLLLFPPVSSFRILPPIEVSNLIPLCGHDKIVLSFRYTQFAQYSSVQGVVGMTPWTRCAAAAGEPRSAVKTSRCSPVECAEFGACPCRLPTTQVAREPHRRRRSLKVRRARVHLRPPHTLRRIKVTLGIIVKADPESKIQRPLERTSRLGSDLCLGFGLSLDWCSGPDYGRRHNKCDSETILPLDRLRNRYGCFIFTLC